MDTSPGRQASLDLTPPAGSRVPRMDASAWLQLSSGRSGTCPSRHHRPRTSRADQAPRPAIVRPVGVLHLDPRRLPPFPGGWANDDQMTCREEVPGEGAIGLVYKRTRAVSATLASVTLGVHRGHPARRRSPLALIWQNQCMSLVPTLEDAAVAQYATAVNLHAVEAPLTVHIASFDAEATNIALSLVAMRDSEVLQEREFVFSVKLVIDFSTHLWSDDGGALKVAVTFDSQSQSMTLRLAFDPAGKGSIAATADVAFLRAVSTATGLALRMPNGDLAPDRIPVPEQFVVDNGLLNSLQLLAEVSKLAGIDIKVPQEIDRDFANDLVVARDLLRGETVHGKWRGGQLSLDIAALSAIEEQRKTAERHQFMIIAPHWLEMGETQIYLGEIAQHISDVRIEDVHVDEAAGKVVLEVSAPNGSSDLTFKPIARAESAIESNIVLPDAVYDELLADLDAPPRHTRLRDLL